MNGWVEGKLGHFISIISGAAFKSEEFVNSGIPVIKIGNIIDGSIKPTNDDCFIPIEMLSFYKEYILKEKDVLIAMSGNTTCKMGRVSKDYSPSLVNQRVGLIRINESVSSEICIDYVYYLLTSEAYQHILWNYATATGQPNLSPRDIKRVKFNKPPLNEQKRITGMLARVDEAIASVQNSIAAAERLKKSLMQNLLTGKMKPDGTFRTPEEFYIDEKFGKVPVGWEIKKLKNIASIQRGKFSHRPRNDERFYNGDFPFVQTSDVVESALYLKRASQSLNELGVSVSKSFPQNTIIMTIAANIGYVALACYKVYFPDSLIGINANEDIVEPTYLLLQLMKYKNILDALATESAQKNRVLTSISEV